MPFDNQVMVNQDHRFGCVWKTPFCKSGHIYSAELLISRLSKGGLSSGYSSVKNVITIVAFIFGVLVFVIHNKLVLALSIH